jgi:aminopeptidase N
LESGNWGPNSGFFQNFYKTEYPLPKMDVAVTPDFHGALENWGLTTFLEDGLLYQEGVTDSLHSRRILIK